MGSNNAARGNKRAGKGAEHPPVLVVPGWGAPDFQSELISRFLRSEGLEARKIRLPRLAVGDMRRSGESLAESAKVFLEETGHDCFNMLGYSLGGLIARVFLQEFDGYRELNRAVFLGAPQESVRTGYLAAFTKSGRQLLPGSGFLQELNRGPESRCGEAKCLSIFLRRDGVIIPSESARLKCGYNLELAWPVFHWGVVFSRKVISCAAEFLKGGMPEGVEAPPTAGRSSSPG